MPQPKIKISAVIKGLISVCGLLFVFYQIPFSEVRKSWHVSMLPWVALSVLSTQIFTFFQAKRWKKLSLQHYVPLKTFYAYTVIGYFFNNLIPGGFGGDIVKSLAFGKRFQQMAQSVASILIARVLGLLALLLCFFAALPTLLSKYSLPSVYSWGMFFSFLICFIILFAFIFSDKFSLITPLIQKFQFLQKLQNSFALYRGHKRLFFFSALDSLWLQILLIFTNYCYFRAVGLSLDWNVVTAFTAITVIITMLPISLNGIGIREIASVSLYSGVLKIDSSAVLAATLLGYIPLLYQVIQGSAVLIGMKKNASKTEAAEKF